MEYQVDEKAIVYISNIDMRVTERILYDILIQAGPVQYLNLPKDHATGNNKGYAFVAYKVPPNPRRKPNEPTESEKTADYAVKLFSGLVKLYEKTLIFQPNAFATREQEFLLSFEGEKSIFTLQDVKDLLDQSDEIIKEVQGMVEVMSRM